MCFGNLVFRFQVPRVDRAPLPNPGNASDYSTPGTNSSTCLTKSPAELVVLSLPYDRLRQVIVDCPIICLVASGSGQPDLAGRGVSVFPSVTRSLSLWLTGPERSSFHTAYSCSTPSSSVLSNMRFLDYVMGCEPQAPTTDLVG